VNRIDRISAILIHLQSRRIVKASDLAERFNISLRTVYRDIRTLEEAGVPITGEAGIGYSIMRHYHLPPVMFTKDEVMALLTAEKLATLLTDTTTTNHLNSAMHKIRAVIGNSDKESIETMDDKIAVLSNPYRSDDWRETSVLKDLTTAIEHKNLLEITYYSNHSLEKNTRTVEPIGLLFQSGRWHLSAWCRLRKDYRNFRVDRIDEHTILSETFKTVHPKLDQFIYKTAHDHQLTEVVLKMDKSIYKYLGDQKLYMGYMSQRIEDNSIIMTFLSQSTEGMARWLLMLGAEVEVIKPKELKKRVIELAQDFLKNY